MSYGATAAIGGYDHAAELAGGLPGGVAGGIDRHPLGLVVAWYLSAFAKRCLELALQGLHLAARGRISPLREQIVGNTDAASDAGFGLSLRLRGGAIGSGLGGCGRLSGGRAGTQGTRVQISTARITFGTSLPSGV